MHHTSKISFHVAKLFHKSSECIHVTPTNGHMRFDIGFIYQKPYPACSWWASIGLVLFCINDTKAECARGGNTEEILRVAVGNESHLLQLVASSSTLPVLLNPFSGKLDYNSVTLVPTLQSETTVLI